MTGLALADATALEPLVIAARAGDRAAFARLVDATSGVVCAIAVAVLGDPAESEDVAQDVYLAAWRALPALRNPASFLPWLRQLTRNRAHHALRTLVRRRRRSAADADALLAAAADPAPLAPDRMIAEEEGRLLAAALDALPDASREVVVLYYREGRSVRQVATLLGVGEEAVKQRLARARSRVREALLERAGETLRATAPTATLGAAVMTALSLATPSTAAAATLTLGKAAAGGKVVAKLTALGLASGLTLGAIAGAMPGLIGGLMGVIGGAVPLYRRAGDDRERRGVVLHAVACTLAMLVFITTITLRPEPALVTAAWLLMLAVFGVTHFGWLPRLARAREAAERAADPAAAARQARDRRRSVLGYVVGVTLSAVPIVWMWVR
ncbi:MAG TPA: RNA polymerase sigma factor [Gemmatimonadaceae bacterium]|nr:RNA polymerase sigma factor [Gemmatimonadaceae bacterium]